jgi:hypothetical protein
VQWCTGAVVHWRTGAMAHWCYGALVHWRTGALAHWCNGALMHWQNRKGILEVSVAKSYMKNSFHIKHSLFMRETFLTILHLIHLKFFLKYYKISFFSVEKT